MEKGLEYRVPEGELWMRRIILFAKPPVAGKVKTRLTPPLSPSSALSLYRAFLTDGFAFLTSFHLRGFQVECSASEPWTLEEAQEELGVVIEGIGLSVQCDGDLGARMFQAQTDSHNSGARATIILGTDAPTVPAELVLDAFRRLENGADAVMSPSIDGGYVLIGCNAPRKELFEKIAWGGPLVASATRVAAMRATDSSNL